MKIKGNYFQNKKCSTSQRSINEKTFPKKIKNDILYALISIYYYENALSLNINKELIFNENKIYYFINPNWIINFKKSYNYQMLLEISKSIKLNGIPITYYNFENNITSIKDYLSQNNFHFKNDEIPDDLMVNISARQKKLNNLVYYPFCYIIDMKIKNIIENYVFQGNKLNICEQKVFAKDNFIYLKFSNTITSGNLDRNFIFISNYVLFFNSSEILLNEKKFLLKNSFSYYLKYKHIDKFNSNKLQLKDDNNNPIGEIILIPKNLTNNNNKVINQSASKKKRIECKSKEDFSDILPNVIFNNTVKRKASNSIKINISKGIERKSPPQCNLNSRKFYINQSPINKPKDDISPNNVCQNHKIQGIPPNDKKLSNINADKDDYNKVIKDNNNLKDNYFVKINPNQNKKVEYGLKNDIKIEENFASNQKSEKNDKNLRKDVNELQKQMKNIENDCYNKFNNLEKKLENNNKANDNLYKKVNNLEVLINKKENQNEIINKENELKKRENKIIERENYLNKRENIISQKENELIKNSKTLNRRENIISKKEDELIKKEYNLDKREKELNIKLKEIKDLSQNNKKSKDEMAHFPIPPVEPNPIPSYKKPTLIGLNNIGATNFINCTLQCLSQTPYLTNYFLKNSKKCKIINNNLAQENKNSLQLSPIYLKLIKKLWDKKGDKSFSPNEFMSTIEKMNPLFKKGQAGDSKDFIIYFLEQIHKELKKKINKNYSMNQSLNQYDKNNSLNYFFNDFSKNCSIISDAFFGFNEITNECVNCKNYYNSQNLKNPICYNYGIFNCLIFPLEEVKNYKNSMLIKTYYNMGNINNMNYMNNINQENSVTLDNCFLYNQKTELFTGENKNYCNICKQDYDSYYTSKIYSSPNNLILILNRGKNNMHNIKLYFNETIDITQYVVINDGNKWTYNLYGVITHIGESGPNAHFLASCKSPVDNKWYRYNDAIVNPINNIQNEVINFGTPYILFYQKE